MSISSRKSASRLESEVALLRKTAVKNLGADQMETLQRTLEDLNALIYQLQALKEEVERQVRSLDRSLKAIPHRSKKRQLPDYYLKREALIRDLYLKKKMPPRQIVEVTKIGRKTVEQIITRIRRATPSVSQQKPNAAVPRAN